MAHGAQLLGDVLTGLPLQLELFPADPLDAGGVQGLLGVHVIVQGVDDDLRLALGLHKGPHHPEGTHRLAVLQQEAGDDGVIGLFAPCQTVVAGGVQGEVGPPVLQGDGRAGDGHAGAKGGVVALDEGHHVPLGVGGTQIDGAAAGGVPCLGRQRLF